MDAVLDYAKVPVTIKSYSKAQSDSKTTGATSDLKDTRCAADTSSTPEEFYGLKTKDDGNFTLDGNLYPLKVFVRE